MSGIESGLMFKPEYFEAVIKQGICHAESAEDAEGEPGKGKGMVYFL